MSSFVLDIGSFDQQHVERLMEDIPMTIAAVQNCVRQQPASSRVDKGSGVTTFTVAGTAAAGDGALPDISEALAQTLLAKYVTPFILDTDMISCLPASTHGPAKEFLGALFATTKDISHDWTAPIINTSLAMVITAANKQHKFSKQKDLFDAETAPGPFISILLDYKLDKRFTSAMNHWARFAVPQVFHHLYGRDISPAAREIRRNSEDDAEREEERALKRQRREAVLATAAGAGGAAAAAAGGAPIMDTPVALAQALKAAGLIGGRPDESSRRREATANAEADVDRVDDVLTDPHSQAVLATSFSQAKTHLPDARLQAVLDLDSDAKPQNAALQKVLMLGTQGNSDFGEAGKEIRLLSNQFHQRISTFLEKIFGQAHGQLGRIPKLAKRICVKDLSLFYEGSADMDFLFGMDGEDTKSAKQEENLWVYIDNACQLLAAIGDDITGLKDMFMDRVSYLYKTHRVRDCGIIHRKYIKATLRNFFALYSDIGGWLHVVQYNGYPRPTCISLIEHIDITKADSHLDNRLKERVRTVIKAFTLCSQMGEHNSHRGTPQLENMMQQQMQQQNLMQQQIAAMQMNSPMMSPPQVPTMPPPMMSPPMMSPQQAQQQMMQQQLGNPMQPQQSFLSGYTPYLETPPQAGTPTQPIKPLGDGASRPPGIHIGAQIDDYAGRPPPMNADALKRQTAGFHKLPESLKGLPKALLQDYFTYQSQNPSMVPPNPRAKGGKPCRRCIFVDVGAVPGFGQWAEKCGNRQKGGTCTVKHAGDIMTSADGKTSVTVPPFPVVVMQSYLQKHSVPQAPTR